MKVYFDFDGTLFDTHLFYRTFWRKADLLYGSDSEEAIAASAEFHEHHVSGLEWYNFQAHADSYGLDSNKINAILEDMRSLSFMFVDSHAALKYAESKYPVEILTFGEKMHQELKVSTEPKLMAYDIHIVQQHKKEFLANLAGNNILIDDKDLKNQMPDNTLFIQINRDSTEPFVRNSDHAFTVNSLYKIKDIF